ncbi:MAG: DUF2929 family protein [Lactovum sp.]
MKFFVVLFWSIGIGQIVGFLGSKLLALSYNPSLAVLVSIIFAFFILILEHFALEKTV